MLLLLHTPGQIASIFDSGFFIGMAVGGVVTFAAVKSGIGRLFSRQ